MAPKKAKGESPWKNATVIAAAIGGAATVAVAVINLVGGSGGDAGGGGSPTPTPSPRSAAIELVTTGMEPVEPPPGVLYWFEGRVEDLKPHQRVFVFGYFDEAASETATDIAARVAGKEGQPTSPPAEYFPGGRWRVDWALPEPPEAARFEAVVVERRGVFGVAPGRGTSTGLPTGDDPLSRLTRDVLLREGLESVRVVARDVVEADPAATETE